MITVSSLLINQLEVYKIKSNLISANKKSPNLIHEEIINAVNALERKITIPYNITMYSGKECECCERNKTFSNSRS